MWMLRRSAVAFAVSLAVHTSVVVGTVGFLGWRGLPWGVPVDVEIASMSLDELKELPLGPPPAVTDEAGPIRPKRKPRPRVASTEAAGSLETKREKRPDREVPPGADADRREPPDAGTPGKPGDLKRYGPEGSRLTVLMRLDRLRGTEYVEAVDMLLSRMPDRGTLLSGTGLDLYKDFDALLIATPNPLDYTATFLAVRHRVSDDKLRDALDRGAAKSGGAIRWRTESGRPVGERRGAPGTAATSRDNRLIVMPAPGLVVVTPPAYARLLLPRRASAAGAGDGGPPAASESPGWGDLLRRIDAHDGAVPENAVVVMTAVDVFRARSVQAGISSVGGGPSAPASPGAAAVPTIWGLALPRTVTVVIGAVPAPFLDILAELGTEDDARAWEAEWPALHRKALANPYLTLAGFRGLVERIEVTRSGSELKIHDSATPLEARRILEMAAGMLGRQRPGPARPQ